MEETKTVSQLHHEAMALAEVALMRRHDSAAILREAAETSKQAYALEKQAAELLTPERAHEPSRSILYRSAATLAVDAGLYQEAMLLVEAACKGFPPAGIMIELSEVNNRAWALMHLQEDDSQ